METEYNYNAVKYNKTFHYSKGFWEKNNDTVPTIHITTTTIHRLHYYFSRAL